MKLFNSKTNKIEQFESVKNNCVNMYVCGPTLYGDIHVGNARPIIFFDVVHRYFKFNGYNVVFVSNVTDIDDKIINKAIELNISEEKLVEDNFVKFQKILSELNILNYDAQPKVTDYINEIISYINNLIDLDYAYIKNENVYFRVDRVQKYGEISNISLASLKSGLRIEVDDNKEYEHDFVLWKKTDKGVTFQAPFGRGRPGWHTECSCMINELFETTIDIHGGGVDLKFPHHENENAQSNACGINLANYWMHNGFVNIDNEKMSKSIGNTILTRDLVEKYGSNVVRLLMYQTNYRQPINIDQHFIDQTVKINSKFEKIAQKLSDDKYVKSDLVDQVNLHFQNDFKIANVLSFMLVNTKQLDDEKCNLFKYCFKILGLNYVSVVHNLPHDVEILLGERKQAKGEKNFELADKIKLDILSLGYEVIDTKNGVICKKK